MRLSAIRFAGFRGARAEVAIELAAGFVVVTGRNGSGKSTICDAVEFAMTGSLRTASGHSEKGEGIQDYVWWRGEREPTERFVELVVTDESGTRYTLRRTPTRFSIVPNISLEEILCHDPTGLEAPLTQLCRTAILRDEEITRMSVDLKETDRFDFVRAALGTADFTAAERRAKDVHDLLSGEVKRTLQTYESASTRVNDLTARLSQARTEVVTTAELAAAEATLREVLQVGSGDLSVLTTTGERRLTDLRMQTDNLTRIFGRAREIAQRRDRPAVADRTLEVKRVQDAIDAARTKLQAAEEEAARVGAELSQASLDDPRRAAFAALWEHGQRLGLVDGHCPLCGAAQSESHFREHLTSLSQIVAQSGTRLAELNKRSTEVSEAVASARAEVTELTSRLDRLRQDEALLATEFEELEKEAQRFDLGGKAIEDLGRIESAVEGRRREALQIERSLARLQASHTAEVVRTLEQELGGARAALVAADKQLSRAKAAMSKSKEAIDTVRRVRGEYINEQLAQLEPLLLEIYQRLRPHIDWPEVRYRLRGDVRRMLSFEIGDGLNPTFVFSSGQRRAAGLAFLLALHLSRSWCALKTLILDDPVQHIDDYRALHLTEVLSAIRRTGQQVICTAEDESLANLLARRMRGDGGANGMLVRMRYSSASGIGVESASTVPLLPRNVLVPA